MLEHAIAATGEYIAKMPKAQRKRSGQFFTSKETAAFMADLFDLPTGREELSILDAGAGSGILSVALIERLQSVQNIKRIELTCYENDPKIIDLLRVNLDQACAHSSIDVEYRLKVEDYILAQYLEYNGLLGAVSDPQKYDLVIGTPPYMKIAKDAPEALAMPDVCYGAPNTYFLFASMGIFDLAQGGELVYIIPRSWTSGAYFRRFRQKFLSEAVLEHIHLFVGRDEVFGEEDVLQETMIVKMRKTDRRPQTVRVTTTQGDRDFDDMTIFDAPYDAVVAGKDSYVYLITNAQEMEALERIKAWKDTLPDLGLPMKTGLTVEYRNRDILRDDAGTTAVPLFYAHHIKDGRVVFPIGKESEYIVTDRPGLLQKNGNYLFVKRFTAKEEPRRLQCGVYLSKVCPGYAKISTQNKINFIGGQQGSSEPIVYGLYVLFNSTLYDRYYRMLNGSTQVNSTEINSMPVPPLGIIETMGKELIAAHDMSEQVCDAILRVFA